MEVTENFRGLANHMSSSVSLPSRRALISERQRSWYSWCMARLYRTQEIALAVVSWPKRERRDKLPWALPFFLVSSHSCDGKYTRNDAKQHMLPANMNVSACALISSFDRPSPFSSWQKISVQHVRLLTAQTGHSYLKRFIQNNSNFIHLF